MILIPQHDPNILEAVLQRLIIAHVNDIENAFVWRANNGTSVRAGRHIKFGVKGQADLTGVIGPTGRRLEIEVKSLRGYQTDDQKNWQKMIESYGGLYILAHSLSEALVPVCKALGLGYTIE